MIGSVFSPYYALSGRADPLNHVGLNVGLYGGGKKRWTLTERGRNDIIQEQHYLKIGPSQLVWRDDCLTMEINEWANPVLRKVSGTIRLYPQGLVTTPFRLDDRARHFWQPLAAVSRVEVTFDNPSVKWQGNAYIDSNWGSEPLETGFRYWDWSRGHSNGQALVLYDAFTRLETNRQFALRISPKGEVGRVEIPPRHPLNCGPLWRVNRSTLADSGAQPQTLMMLEDTPFYTRSHINTSVHGEAFTAVHESLDLDRFSKTWVRCLLPFRMPRVASKG